MMDFTSLRKRTLWKLVTKKAATACTHVHKISKTHTHEGFLQYTAAPAGVKRGSFEWLKICGAAGAVTKATLTWPNLIQFAASGGTLE